MDIYKDAAHRLYVRNTKIGETVFHQWEDYVDALNEASEFKGSVFLTNLMAAMVSVPNHFGLRLRGDFYKQVLKHCKLRIDETTGDRVQVQAPNTNSEGALPEIDNTEAAKMFTSLVFPRFLDIERQLYDLGHIDNNRRWLESKVGLVQIKILFKAGKYIRSGISKAKLTKFFADRYDSDISQQAQPRKIEAAKNCGYAWLIPPL